MYLDNTFTNVNAKFKFSLCNITTFIEVQDTRALLQTLAVAESNWAQLLQSCTQVQFGVTGTLSIFIF